MPECWRQKDSGITVRSERVSCLSDSQRMSMLLVYKTLFEMVAPEVFFRDLDEKGEVILIEQNGGIVGFSTCLAYDYLHEGCSIRVLFSGDTLILKEYRGTMAFLKFWINKVLKDGSSRPDIPLYWLLLAGSYRTYRFLPVFFKNYYPAADPGRDNRKKSLLESICRARYGHDFYPDKGIVIPPGAPRLRSEYARHAFEGCRNQHVAYYFDRNRWTDNGAELACLCEISLVNLTSASRRLIKNGLY